MSGPQGTSAKGNVAVVTKEHVPGAPGVFLLSDVLTDAECKQLIAVSEAMGYCPDAPVSLSRDVRQNDNCVWIADQNSLNKVVFHRCRDLLPEYVYGGEEVFAKKDTASTVEKPDEKNNAEKPADTSTTTAVPRLGPVTGLNQRWRLYRYNESDIFRPHTDGSWPGSGLTSDKKSLVQDLYDGAQHSMLTFLLYLNDDCEGGETTFYYAKDDAFRHLSEKLWAKDPTATTGTTSSSTPSASTTSSGQVDLCRVSVRPKKGAALVFWHGQHPLSPLHEGSKVQNGSKYVIRTDVLYDIRENWGAFFRSISALSSGGLGTTSASSIPLGYSVADPASRLLQQHVRQQGTEQQKRPPVGNLSMPDERINRQPCLLLFLDNLDASGQVDAAVVGKVKREMATLAAEFAAMQDDVGNNASTFPVYCAVSSAGAVGQIRQLLSHEGQVGGEDDLLFVLLDMPKGQFVKYDKLRRSEALSGAGKGDEGRTAKDLLAWAQGYGTGKITTGIGKL
ncbi:unnamed protein product [Amoebophrya sp. A25]|nr:unnamed protein product [Amoebophrya sp. A25]|eukprot:GSA25T00003682001.1